METFESPCICRVILPILVSNTVKTLYQNQSSEQGVEPFQITVRVQV